MQLAKHVRGAVVQVRDGELALAQLERCLNQISLGRIRSRPVAAFLSLRRSGAVGTHNTLRYRW
jgi:hypothetical protein